MSHETTTSTELIEQLNAQTARIESLKEHLETLNAARQNQSYFSRFAFFYGELAWWKKIIAAGVFLAVPSIILFFCGFSFLPLLPLASIYCSGIFLLSNHYEQDHNLAHKALDRLTSILTMSIQTLDETHERFNARITALNALHTAEENSQNELSQHIEDIEQTNQTYHATVAQLNEPVQRLTHTTTALQEQTQKLIGLLTQTNTTLDEALQTITETLLPNLSALLTSPSLSQHTFVHFDAQFQKNLLHMDSFIHALDNTLYKLETNETTGHDTETTCNEKTNRLLQAAEAAMAEAACFIEQAAHPSPYSTTEPSVKIPSHNPLIP